MHAHPCMIYTDFSCTCCSTILDLCRHGCHILSRPGLLRHHLSLHRSQKWTEYHRPMALKFRPNHLSPREPLVDSGTILYPTLLLFLSLSIWYNTAIGRDKLVLNINCKISIDKKAVFVMELNLVLDIYEICNNESTYNFLNGWDTSI